ncbi:hypothetical protein KsCSTR_36840 [Candidatus Kuenenia stuttgartiensis]|uniref:Uncharacterized protein n=1 Tax=Kuenenia stuttgartiensis TaxID=174633 RepID=A0A6G7GUR6_KUEST|nr:hypothetical protein KsCSTR_36840 [Candidatus Kuenenia stuttgartiensis]
MKLRKPEVVIKIDRSCHSKSTSTKCGSGGIGRHASLRG